MCDGFELSATFLFMSRVKYLVTQLKKIIQEISKKDKKFLIKFSCYKIIFFPSRANLN